MKLTKYGHACFTVEKEGQILVVDPGVLSTDFTVTENIIGIVVTHEHPDHFDPDTLARIYDKNPESLLLSTQAVVEKMIDHSSRAVKADDIINVGPFSLEFFGGRHAHIYGDVPELDNVGVFIDDTLYYPGDSLTQPGKPIDTLALPLGAPWLKTSEAIDFVLAVKPRQAFPTHDAVLSSAGQSFNDSWLSRFTEPAGITYTRLDGKTVEL